MKYKSIEFNDEIKNRIYLKTLDKIINYEEKKVKKFRLIGILSLSLAILILLLNILIVAPNLKKKELYVNKETKEITLEKAFVNTYGDFLSFTENSDNFNDYSSENY